MKELDSNNKEIYNNLDDARALEPSQQALEAKNVYAIIIGINDYPGIADDLRYSVSSSGGIYHLLLNDYNFKWQNIFYLQDIYATSDGISDAIDIISSKITSNDVFFFYFAGHGGYTPSYFMYLADGTLFTADHLKTKLNSFNCSEKYIILDCCHSGGFIPQIESPGTYIITSSLPNQLSYESSQLKKGVFTHFFLKAKNDATDNNADGVLSIEEMFPYARDKTATYMFFSGYSQTPQQCNGILKESVLKTTLCNPTFETYKYGLRYNFTLYGTGFIKNLKIILCFYNEEIDSMDYLIEDLTDHATTTTGFEFYNGTIIDSRNITSWGFFAEIRGNRQINIYKTEESMDLDKDGLKDALEIFKGLNPLDTDSDNDLLDDFFEYNGLTDPLFPDCDLDGLCDGFEVFYTRTNPLNKDSDGDGKTDKTEFEEKTDALDPKSYINPQLIQNIIITSLSIFMIGILAIYIVYSILKLKQKSELKNTFRNKQYLKKCEKCGFQNEMKNKHCINCGEILTC